MQAVCLKVLPAVWSWNRDCQVMVIQSGLSTSAVLPGSSVARTSSFYCSSDGGCLANHPLNPVPHADSALYIQCLWHFFIHRLNWYVATFCASLLIKIHIIIHKSTYYIHTYYNNSDNKSGPEIGAWTHMVTPCSKIWGFSTTITSCTF